MSVMNYVTELPEVGCPLLNKLAQIRDLEQAELKLRQQRSALERDLAKQVRGLWTPTERQEARARHLEASKARRRAAYQEAKRS